jgi:hypothetical protein
MTAPTGLTRLHQFILEYFDREGLRTLCFNLGVDYDSLPAEGEAAQARELVLALGRRHQLARLLTVLQQARPEPFAEAKLDTDSQAVAALQAEFPAFEQAAIAGRPSYKSSISPLAPTLYIEPKRSGRRRLVALVVIAVVIGGLLLSLVTQPWKSPAQGIEGAASINALLWIGQVIVSFFAVLASVAELSGFNMRELFSTRPAGTSAEAFPFDVIHSFDELLDHIFPDPEEPVLPDRSIPYIPRIASELDVAFRQRGRVLIRGRSKTGKSREATESLRRWWHTGPTVLLAKNNVHLYPPYHIPDNLPVRNLVLFFDDIDRYCGDADAVERLGQTIAFFANLCHEPGELRVIATARQEPEFWSKLGYQETVHPWAEFTLLTVPALSPDSTRQLINHLAQLGGVDIEPGAAEEMSIKNDGTFLNIALSFRSWIRQGLKHIGPEQVAAFEGELANTWKSRYERLVQKTPLVGPIYAAVNLLQKLNVPLRPALITEIATEMNVSHVYHVLAGLLYWLVWYKLDLSPWLDWYRDPRHRRRGLALGGLCAILMLYALCYLALRFVPIPTQFD